MTGFDPAFSVSVYGRAIAVGLIRTLTETSWLAAIMLLFPIWVWLKNQATP